jgi:hypothetical protein
MFDFVVLGGFCEIRLLVRTRRSQLLHQASNLFGALLWEKDGMDVWKNTARGNGDSSKELVELFVIFDSEGKVTWNDTALLVVAGGVAGKFENLGAEVLKDCCQVNRGTSTHTSRVLSLTEVTSDTTDRELKTGFGRSSGGLLLTTASLTLSFA